MKTTTYFLLTILGINLSTIKAQNIAINSTGAAPNPSAILDVDASPGNNKGFLMPRLTTVQRLAIATPAAGLQVYDTNLKGVYVFDGTWDCLNTPAGTVQYFANTTSPRGYLECNGQSVSAVTYPELFTAIGYTYGGAGASFNVPDLRGEFIRGYDNGRGINSPRVIGSFEPASTHRELGGAGGAGTINHYWSDNKLGVITDAPVIVAPVATNGGPIQLPRIDNMASVVTWEFTHRPRNVALMPCIKF